MSDVLARLMLWMETSDIDDADVVLRDAITEIAGLRARLDEHRQVSLQKNLTLTDAERSLLTMLVDHPRTHELMYDEEATLRGLLERTKEKNDE